MQEKIAELKQVPFELVTAISKIIWWFVLVVVGILFFNQQRDFLNNGTLNSVNTLILVVWIVLLLMPFFQEISFYGLKVKKELETLKSDINNQIINLKNDLENSIALQTQINPNIYLNSVPDSQIPKFKEEYRSVLKEELEALGITADKIELPEIDKNTLYLFSVRYQLEKELKRILADNLEEFDSLKAMPFNQLLRYAVKGDIIDRSIYSMAMKINFITNAAIHGSEVSETKVLFVKDIYPELIAVLKQL